MPDKLKIGLVLNSHRDESLNYVLMHSYWFKSKGLVTSLDILYVGNNLNFKTVLPILETLSDFGNVKVTHIPVYEIQYSKIYRIYLMLKTISRSVLLVLNSKVVFVAYDLPLIFLRLLSFLKKKNIFALPHTLGFESYRKGIFKANKRPLKSIPVIAKIPCSKEYFHYLGFTRVIFAGVYYSNRVDDFFKKLIQSEDQKLYGAIVYAIHSDTRQYSRKSWVSTFTEIFCALKEANLNDIGIALHPSQPATDFELLQDLASEFGIEIARTEGFALKIIHQSNCFINVMTSAGQLSYASGKRTCNYGSNNLRKEMLDFGNDPFPYLQFNVEEIETSNDLLMWLLENRQCNRAIINSQQPLDFNELIKVQ